MKLTLAFLALSVVAWAQAPAEKQVEVFGQSIHYVEAGSGPTVILLHGLGGDSSNWAATVPALAAHYHVYAPDQIGFGKSDKPQINYRVGTLVDFLDGFYKKLGIAKASVVGNSLGGWTAIGFALAHPDKVDRMVLVDSAGYSPARTNGVALTRDAMMQLNPSTVEGTKQLMRLVLANKLLVNQNFAEQLFTAHLKKSDGYTINQFIESILRGEDYVDGKLGGIKAPTLIVWGREDLLTPPAGAKALAEDIPGAELVMMDHCGHVPQIECAAPFNATLGKFLAGEPVQQSAR